MPTLIYSKYALVAKYLHPQAQSVLDVGCRDGVLRQHLKPEIRYTGVDLSAGPQVTKVCNVEDGLPFPDQSFDAVVALDLLEHTDDIWFVFDELWRVSRRQIIVVLPNMYHWQSRLKFLFGKEMGKYELPAKPIVDRHRWLTSYRSARTFCSQNAQKHDLVVTEKVLYGGRKSFLVDATLCVLSKNLGAWAGMFLFERPSNKV